MGKRSKTKEIPPRDPSPLSSPLAVYYVTVILIVGASIWPTGRVWGLNWWAYFPGYVQLSLAVVALVLPMLGRVANRTLDRPNDESSLFWPLASIASICFIVLFIILRAQAYFLGDGYTLIGLLAREQPILKYREIGESLAHLWVRDLFGGADPVAALRAYQTISIAAGVLFVSSAAAVSKRLFENWRAAITFLCGMLSGGYLLLFFGYVENYSLFVLAVAWFAWTGMFINDGRISRWWILVAQAAAIGFHVFGISLLPATMYCLFWNSSAQKRWGTIKKEVRWAIIGVVIVKSALLFIYFYLNDLFFRIAILPVFPHEFTVEGYTLLSLAHLMDLANLILLLVPGLLVFLAVILSRRSVTLWQHGVMGFLLMMLCSSFLAAFIFDPKIGMPRDWDLFSFAGIPLAALIFYYLLNRKTPMYAVAWMIIGLGMLVLIPRAASQAVESVAFKHALAYKDLDRVKNRQFYTTLTNYCRATGRISMEESLVAEMHRRFPGRAMGDEAHRLVLAGRHRDAITLAGKILNKNPLYHGVWANMGTAYLYIRNYDSAIACYEIASALNPGRAELYGNTGSAYLELGELDEATRLLEKAIDTDSTKPSFFYNLGRIAKARGDIATYEQLLAKSAIMPGAYTSYRLEYVAHLMKAGDVAKAREVMTVLREQGVGTRFLDSLCAIFPELRE